MCVCPVISRQNNCVHPSASRDDINIITHIYGYKITGVVYQTTLWPVNMENLIAARIVARRDYCCISRKQIKAL